MKLFPHILARVGGGTFSKVAALSFGKMSFVNVLLQKVSDLEFQFEKVLQSFQATFENTEDYQLRAILKNGKKDFQNQRFSFFKKLQKLDQEEILSDLLFNISVYSDWKLELENLRNEFDLIFKKEELSQYTFLKDFFQNENFQKGILQSSHSLFHQNKKLTSKLPKDYRKKERQTLRALAQYFYRIGGKTSPFSHFTTLDLLSKKSGIFKNENLEIGSSYFQYNNFILAEMKALLLQEPIFFRQLKLQVNPSILVKNNGFHFIKNTKNIETIQQIEVAGILEQLSQTIIPKEGLTFDLAVTQLLELVEADQASIESYLLELIELGFLEWQWGFSGLTFNWEKKFLDFLISIDDFSNKEGWIICLEKMIQGKVQLEFRDQDSRFFFQDTLKNNLEKLGLKNVNLELLFFEDVRKPASIQLPESEVAPIIQSLDSLLRLLEPLMKNEMQDRILHCWSKNFKGEKSVPLLDFYQKYFQTYFYNNTSTNSEKGKIINFIKSRLKEFGEIDEEGNLVFYLKDLESFFPKRPISFTTCYSGLFQFYKKGGKLIAVINGLTPGYGKLFGRFLPLFSEEITIQLQKWNAEIQDESMWVENVDASIFNANLHPSLLNLEIKNATSENNLFSENLVPINEIEVIWDDDLKEPILVFSKTKKRISIFDFGFEHPENRSPMFQLLNGFSLPHATYRFFLEWVNELFCVEKPNGIKVFRRVVIDDHLILQRKSQEVPHSFFPQKEKSESNSSYFLKMQKWKSVHHFSQYIFIRPLQDLENSNKNLKKDFFKPQLIDLNSPLAIVLLQKVLEKHLGRIRLEEMLPKEEEMMGDSVAEFGVQWGVGG